MTEAEYQVILARQSGGCAICNAVPEYRLRVDHCHETGRVRGLLCHSCNVGLGWFRDDPKRMRAAVAYLIGDHDADGAGQGSR